MDLALALVAEVKRLDAELSDSTGEPATEIAEHYTRMTVQ